MADTPIDERKFSDKEVREILRRAVERAPSQSLTPGEGLSLTDLKAVGREVGIDPARVEEAARAVDQGGGSRADALVGGRLVQSFERRVEGEIDPSDTPEVLALIRRIMGRQGQVEDVRGSLEWSTTGDVGQRYVTVSSKDGGTSISGSANLTNLAVVSYLPSSILGVIATGLAFIGFAESGNPLALIPFFGILPSLYVLIRSVVGRVSRSEAAKLQQVVDELARLAERATSSTGPSEPSGSTGSTGPSGSTAPSEPSGSTAPTADEATE